MRICHVITKPELGGAQVSTLNILSDLPRDKYDISIITSAHGMLEPEFRGLENAKAFFSRFLVRPINPVFDILAFIHIYLIYRCHKYDLVHTHSSKAGIIGRWAARLANIPTIIHTAHGWSFNDYQHPIVRKFYIFLERITARVTTKIICVSKHDIDTALRYKIAQGEKLTLIKYGILLRKFRGPKTDIQLKKRGLGIANNDPVIGMVSCLKPQKSPADYVRAAIEIYKEMPAVNFLMVGDGVLRSQCKKILDATTLNGRFIFTGWRRDVSEILDVLDVVVLTSKWEGMPISIIEALSKGCVVVATDAGGTSELVKDNVTGYIVQPGSYRQVARKVINVLNDRQLFQSVKNRAYSFIDDSFDVSRMVNEIHNLYQRLTR